MGVDGVPHCLNTNVIGRTLNSLVGNWLVYSWLAQRLVGPAGYYRSHTNYQSYQHKSTFLADLNNESGIDEDSRQRFINLNRLVLIKFNHDTMIIPKETSQFQSYVIGD